MLPTANSAITNQMEQQTYPMDQPTQTEGHSPDLASSLQAVKAHASETADHFRHAAGEKITELQEAAGEEVRYLKLTAEEYAGQIENYIRAKPLKSAVASVGLGLILGLLIRR